MPHNITIQNGRIYENLIRGNFFTDHYEQRVTDPSQMCFPNGRRSCYQAGDTVFRYIHDTDFLARNYREYAHRLDQEYSIGTFAMHLLDLDQANVFQRIEAITGTGTSATVTLRHFLRISNDEVLEIHPRSSGAVSFVTLNTSFSAARVYDAGKIWSPIGEFLFTIITLPIGGAARTLGTRIVGRLMRRSARAVLRRLFRLGGRRLVRFVLSRVTRKTAVFLAKVTADTVRGVVRGYYSELRNNELRGSVSPTLIRSMDLDTIIRTAVWDSVADNLTGVVVDGIGSIIPGGEDPTQIISRAMQERITSNVSRKILQTALGPLTEFLRAAIRELNVGDDERSYSVRLSERFNRQLRQYFSGDRLSDIVGSSVREIASHPNILLGGG